jgi:hypothetical protein
MNTVTHMGRFTQGFTEVSMTDAASPQYRHVDLYRAPRRWDAVLKTVTCYGSCARKTAHRSRRVQLDGVLFIENRCSRCGFERVTNPATGEMLTALGPGPARPQ